MGDLFFHLGFARHLRNAEGLHPVVVEAMVRRPMEIAVGATLPLLPGLEQPKISWWRKLFLGAGDPDVEWVDRLRGPKANNAGLPIAMLTSEPAGPMMRFALGLGALAYEISRQSIEALNKGVDASILADVERAQARLWLHSAVPSHKDFGRMWSPAVITHDDDHLKRLIETLDAAMRKTHGDPVGIDHLRRWLRALSDRVTPMAERSEPPPSLDVADHEAKDKYFESKDFNTAVQSGVEWFVTLAHELGPKYVGGEPTGPDLEQILFEGDQLRRPEAVDLARSQQRAKMDINALRAEHLGRGRNDTPAFDEASIPPLAQPGITPPAPDEDEATMEVPVAPSGDEDVAPDQTEPVPAAPADTQQVAVADIQEEVAAAEIPKAPADTQQVSLAQIEEEMASADKAEGAQESPGFEAPPNTQAVSAAQIEEEGVEEAEARPTTPPLGTPKPKTPPLGTPAPSSEASAESAAEEPAAEEPAEEPAAEEPAEEPAAEEAAAEPAAEEPAEEPAAEEPAAEEPAAEEPAAEEAAESAEDAPAEEAEPAAAAAGATDPSANGEDEDEIEETMRFPVPPPSKDVKVEDAHEETMRFPVPPPAKD
jgi:hypothetical protein